MQEVKAARGRFLQPFGGGIAADKFPTADSVPIRPTIITTSGVTRLGDCANTTA
jgi:hypothetical protein